MKKLDRIMLALGVAFFASTYLYAPDACARAGGGGGGGGHCGWTCVIIYPFVLIYSGYVALRIHQKARQVSAALKIMAEREPQWAEDRLTALAREKFILLQDAWSEQNLDILRANMFPEIYADWERQIRTQIATHEKNIVQELRIKRLRIVEVKNYADDKQDEFTVAFDAAANDRTLQDGVLIKEDNSDFREFWTFGWNQNQWLLKSVDQADGWKRFVNAHIVYEKSGLR